LKPIPGLRTANLILAILLILVMGSQLGLALPMGKARLPITIADAVLALALVGVALQLLSRRGRGLRLPPVQAFVLVAIACVAATRSASRLEAAKEALQLAEYVLVAYFVFTNIAEMSHLKPFFLAFAAATGLTVLWALWHYLRCESPLDVRAGFLNRNALGAFLALSLPVLYGLALHIPSLLARVALLAIVAVGLMVNLSGGAVLVTLLVLGFLSAVRGERVLLLYAAALGIVALVAPWLLPRPHHTDALVSSVAPYVGDNFLLSDRQLFQRARDLREAYQASVADPQKVRDDSEFRSLFDAANLMRFLAARRGAWPLTPEERQLHLALLEETTRVAKAFPLAERRSALGEPQVAARYQTWHAAVACSRTLWDDLPTALFGLGFGDYHKAIDRFRPGPRLQYRSDEPEVFNVASSEPFTHDIWLKALVQTGLLGLLALGWFVASFLGRALRLYAAARSELMLGLSLGAAGGILGFALAGIFTETLARGLAIPAVFICALIAIGERVVHGDRKASDQAIPTREY